jgi:hypothetical protein
MVLLTKPVASVGSGSRVVGVDSVFGVGVGGSRGSSDKGHDGRKSNEELHFGWIGWKLGKVFKNVVYE